ncbi:hypothetical protein AVEN_174677-1 [Araneus ventricosus]|uniref:Uncharacterized protein n=1 Tax=Araneus ventricosus TaxID=182803 RepID=A0A4Y2BJH1_ARAVE|nr:hypothetical protein AVEN_174677-1 [Araneus ventricosus]
MIPAAAANEAARVARDVALSLPTLYPQRHQEANLLLFNISAREPSLTLWKIYRIEKSLLISTVGSLVTYGLLVGTFGTVSSTMKDDINA